MKIRGTTIATPIKREAVVDDGNVCAKPWSSKNTIDKLCPSFVESGAIVTCEPVEGYPLRVTEVTGATTITRCGKNLLDLNESDIGEINFIGGNGNANNYYGYAFLLPPGSYVLKAYPASTATEGYIYGVVTTLDSKYMQHWRPVYGSVQKELPATFTQWVKFYIYEASLAPASGYAVSSAIKEFAKWNIQLEVGNTATAFEPYNGESFELSGSLIPSATIPALPGVNTIWADTGEVTVTGRADPTAVINKLTNAIVALGGNI